MVRTRASVGAKDRSSGSGNYSGGNPACPRETPQWQKPITDFFASSSTNTAGNSNYEKHKAVPTKLNVNTELDDKEKVQERSTNDSSDEEFLLQPLNGESCHKIYEYYSYKDKQGKESNKENIAVNSNKPRKRSFEDVDDDGHHNKKIKID